METTHDMKWADIRIQVPLWMEYWKRIWPQMSEDKRKTSITLWKVRYLFCSPLILKKVSKTYLSLRSQVTPWSVLNYLWINGRRWYACRWNPQCSWVTLLLLIRKSCSSKHPKRPSLRQNYNDSSQMFQIYKGFDCNEHFVLIFGTKYSNLSRTASLISLTFISKTT